MPFRPDTPLAATPESRFQTVQDTIKPKKTYQQMTQPEKVAKKEQLMKSGVPGAYKNYKDSISADTDAKLSAGFAKAAEKAGMSVDKYRRVINREQKRNSGYHEMEGLNSKSNTKSFRKSPCKGGFCTGLNPS